MADGLASLRYKFRHVQTAAGNVSEESDARCASISLRVRSPFIKVQKLPCT